MASLPTQKYLQEKPQFLSKGASGYLMFPLVSLTKGALYFMFTILGFRKFRKWPTSKMINYDRKYVRQD